jgi:hypothetical protein
LSDTHEKFFSLSDAVGLKVLIVRESAPAATLVRSCVSACQRMVGSTFPVIGSMFWETILPPQVSVSYVVLKICRSVWVMFGLEVAAAAAAATWVLRAASAPLSPLAREAASRPE